MPPLLPPHPKPPPLPLHPKPPPPPPQAAAAAAAQSPLLDQPGNVRLPARPLAGQLEMPGSPLTL